LFLANQFRPKTPAWTNLRAVHQIDKRTREAEGGSKGRVRSEKKKEKAQAP